MQIQNPYIQYMYSYPHKTAYRKLDRIDLKAFFNRLTGKKNSLYFHIPFCQYKCGYCNLFSLAGQEEELMQNYVAAMEQQAEQFRQAMPEGVEFSDLTIGGGTPLMLSEKLLERIFRMAEDYFGFRTGESPMIVETSPNQTTKPKLDLLKRYGVTRVSIGVQSFQPEELRALSRFHTVEEAKRALGLIRQEEFSCVNVDLIYGIPGQTKETLGDSVKQAVAYHPDELFVYPLYIKEGTGLYRQNVSQEKATYELYLYVRELLKQEGYQPYSMRRFVKRDILEENDRREMTLCGFGNTLSIGCGGRSYIENFHFCTPYAVKQENCRRIVKEYIHRKDYLQVDYGFFLNEEEQKRRYVIKHILFGEGIYREDYHKHFGTEPEEDFSLLKTWMEKGYAKRTERGIAFTEEGFSLSDYLGPQLISEEVRKRMEEWKEKDEEA